MPLLHRKQGKKVVSTKKVTIELFIDEEKIRKEGYDPLLYYARRTRELKSEFKGEVVKHALYKVDDVKTTPCKDLTGKNNKTLEV